ncbi:hypothetical protein MLD38_022759 [Melastoma candidum]|uniref:Uncharacterized protein n=1 Tax=Melastoma candidum TaxID=119954 RepID=A0ACB9QKD6_9MYRT|nr:hypothetical protein MLD38_022759 [Melastoma candidum]
MACTIDFRCLDEGFGGKTYKRKRQPPTDDLSSMHIDPNPSTISFPPSKRVAVPSLDDPDKPYPAPVAVGAPTYDGVIAGKVSGRKWKQPRKQRTSAVRVTVGKKSYEERQKERELKKAYRERKEELKEEIRKNKVEKRKRMEEMRKKKEENILRSGTKLQRISNPNTLKKLAKSKQRKLLKVVPDDVLNKGKGRK